MSETDAETRALMLRAAELLDRLGAFARYLPAHSTDRTWMESGDARLTYGNVRDAKAIASEIIDRVTPASADIAKEVTE